MPRLRLLKKFVEHDYENVDRLVEMMEAAEGRLKAVNQEIELEQQVCCLYGRILHGRFADA